MLTPSAPSLLAGSAEFFGGLALALGFLTRPAAFVNAIAMLVAILAVHIGNGLFMSNNGYEYALTLFVVSVAFVIQGGGRFAMDNVVLRYLSGGAARQRAVA